MSLEQIGVDAARREEVDDAILLVIKRRELRSVELHGFTFRGRRRPVRFVERVGDRACDVLGEGDGIDCPGELLEDAFLAHVDLRFAAPSVNALAVCASVVVEREPARLHLRGIRDLAATRGISARKGERPLSEEAIVLPLRERGSSSEGRPEVVPLVGGEHGLVLALVLLTPPLEATLVAVMRAGQRGVEHVLEALLDRRAAIVRNESKGDELLGEARLTDQIEAMAAEAETHLAAEKADRFG